MTMLQGFEANRETERRNERRHRVFRGGHIAFNGGYSAFECVVRDLSEHGARLAFGEFAAVPNEFELTIKGAGGRRHANVAWRAGSFAGVTFS
ncbi:MAG: PilZ domain-containing protein [Rhizobiaceae bacterium]